MNTATLPIPAPTADDAAKCLVDARNYYSAILLTVARDLFMTVSDPNPPNPLTNKQKVEIAEQAYKISGLASKQTAAQTGPGFSIKFNFGAGPSQSAPMTIDVTPETSELPDAPPGRIPMFVVNEDLVADDEVWGE